MPAASAAAVPDASHVPSGHHTPQRSRAGSGAGRSRTGSAAGRSRASSSAGRSREGSLVRTANVEDDYSVQVTGNGGGVNADEVDARLKVEAEKGPEILVHEAVSIIYLLYFSGGFKIQTCFGTSQKSEKNGISHSCISTRLYLFCVCYSLKQ